MGKIKLALGAELDVLDQQQLDQTMGKHSQWERDAAFGLRHIDLPLLQGKASAGGVLALGGDQVDGRNIGPTQGYTWSVKRLSVTGFGAPTETVQVFKDSNFVCTIGAASGFVTFSKGALMLRPGDFLRLTGTGLTANEQITMSGEADMAPGPLIWKLLS